MDDAETGAFKAAEQLWKNFNYAWLALGGTQKNALLDEQRPANLISRDFIVDMIETLVHLGDRLEKYGLVDYDKGMWEERITAGMSSS